MRKYYLIIFSLIVGLSMISCGDDTGVNIIDIDDNDDDDAVGTVYSISFDVAGSSDTFTFFVDMDGAVVEGDDLPDWFDGDQFEFDPENHRVFIAGSLGGDNTWNQPGTNSALRLSRDGRSSNVTVEAGEVEFKFFIVLDGMDFDENEGWDLGEWFQQPNRRVEVAAAGEVMVDFGDKPEAEEPPAVTELFMIGDGVGSWEWDDVDLPMVATAEKPDLFWKIVWLFEGGEFKFAPQRAWEGNDFGSDEEDPVNEIYQIGGDNVAVPGETGYYMVVVNLETEEIAVTAPQVYLIGNTIGDWDTAIEDALFTVDNDNEVLTITKELEADELRMYAWFDKGWFTDWWQSEFMIFDGEIEFRADGDDQERVNIDPADDYTIKLNFRSGEGSIEAQ